MQQHLSAITNLHNQLTTGHITNLTNFWREAESLNVPLVVPVEGAEDEREVAFLWRAQHPLQDIYLRLNRVTDKEHVEEGMVNALPETDIWALMLHLPVSYYGSYLLLEIPSGTTAKTIALSGGRLVTLAGEADLLNKMPEINVRGNTRESVLILDKAPALSEWNGGFHIGQLLTSMRIIAGKSRQVRLYTPDVDISQSLGLVMLSDDETWFDHLGVCTAIDTVISNGRIVLVAVLGIDNTNERERIEVLGGRGKLIKDIVRHLLPIIRAKQPQHQQADHSHTVPTGQSLGEISALIGAYYAPEMFGLMLNRSPSVQWTPGRTSRPDLFSETDTPWVSEHLLSAPPQGVRISLCVRSLEGLTVPHVQQLHRQLITAGVKSHCAIYTGGHDYA